MQGERGKQGDHGQAGDTGLTGATGAIGPRGPAGTPRWYHLTDRRLMAIFAIVVFAFTLVLWQYESQQAEILQSQKQIAKAQDRIETNSLQIAVANYDRCRAGVSILTQFNEYLDTLIEIELAEPQDSKTKRRVAAYDQAKVLVPSCDRYRVPIKR